MNNTTSAILMQWAFQAPALLVYLAGAVIAINYWSRYPRPAAFVLIATGLKLMLSLGLPIVHQILINLHNEQGGMAGDLGRTFSMLGMLSALVHAAAVGLLIAAAFVDRGPRFDPTMPDDPFPNA